MEPEESTEELIEAFERWCDENDASEDKLLRGHPKAPLYWNEFPSTLP